MDDRVILVTGGTSGIGLATARAYLERGDSVAICGRSSERLKAATAQLGGAPGRLHAVTADVTSSVEVDGFVRSTVDVLGPPDVGVLAAGLAHWVPLAEMTDEQWRSTVATNLDGAFFAARALLPHLRNTGRGHLMVLSSVMADQAVPNMSAYVSAKAGIAALARSLAAEVKRDHVKVTVVSPGTTETAMREHQVERPPIPATTDPRLQLAPEDVAEAIVTVSDASPRSYPTEIRLEPPVVPPPLAT